MSKSVTMLASLALAVLPAPAHAATRAVAPGEVTWSATQRRSPHADALCRDGSATVTARYTGTHGLTALLVSGAKRDYADYPAFMRGPLIFSSSTFDGPDSYSSRVGAPAPSRPGAEDGPAVLGVEVLDLQHSSKLLWFRSWNFPLACGYDYEITIEDVDRPPAAGSRGA